MAIGNSEHMRMRPSLAGGLVLLAALFMAAMVTFTAAQQEPQPAAVPPNVFRIGVMAEPGAGTGVEGLSDIRLAYARVLGREVEFFVARSYAALIDAHVAGHIDYAIYSSATAYAAAYRRCECVEPLVAPVGEDGEIGIRSVLITRDGRLKSATDLNDHKIVLGPADSIAANRMPLASLRLDGRPLSGTESFFVQAESTEKAEQMFVEGLADAIFGWVPVSSSGEVRLSEGTMERIAAAGIEPSTLDVVWQSGTLRTGPHAISSVIDAETGRKLRDFLIGLKDRNPELYGHIEKRRKGGFVPVSLSDYAVALNIIDAVSALPEDSP